MMSGNWALAGGWAAIIAMIGVMVLYEPPAPPPPPVATPESGQAFAPFVFIDSATGCEYLSTHLNSALTPRLAADGKTHKGCGRAAAPPEGTTK